MTLPLAQRDPVEKIPAQEGAYAGFPSFQTRACRHCAGGVEPLLPPGRAIGLAEKRGRGHPYRLGKTLLQYPRGKRIFLITESRAWPFPKGALAGPGCLLEGAGGELQIDLRTHTYDGDTAPGAPGISRAAISSSPTRYASRRYSASSYLGGQALQNLKFRYRRDASAPASSQPRGQCPPPAKRVCRFTGRRPFILCSATIANPVDWRKR